MRAIVTGGAGFIGSHLCERLVKEGYEVVCIDNLYTGSKKNLSVIEKDVSFVKKDIENPFDIEGTVDEIYNLASPASPVAYQSKPIETMLANSYGVKNTLDLALKKNARFFHTSTSEVYGNPLVHPQTESYFGNVNPIGPRACYDESKRFAEALIMNYHWQHKLETRMVRIFNTYGPRMQEADGRVMPNFIMQALTGKPLTVYGRGEQTRSFCYVSDMVEGIRRLMKSDYASPVNIGNPAETTILELAKTIIEVTGASSELVYKDMPVDDPERRRPDITLARKILGWEPKIQLSEGLKKTIDWFREEKL